MRGFPANSYDQEKGVHRAGAVSSGCIRDKCYITSQVTLEPTTRGFYTAGDVISGVIDLHITGILSITDVQVKLRCDEYSVARYYSDSNRQTRRKGRGGFIRPLRLAARQKAVEHLGKAGNLDEDTIDILSNGLRVVRERKKHYQLTNNAFSSASDERKTTLSEGRYCYPFSMRVSEAVNKCPPHAPIWSEHGLKVGVHWTVKVVVRRPGRFQANVREVIPVPVYPESPHKAHLNSSGRKTVRADRESLHGHLFARLTYPTAGITQDRQPIPFKLDVAADGRVDIGFIKMALAQTCIAKAQGLKETYSRSLDLAVVRGPRIENESVDLLPYIDPVCLERIIEPTVGLKNIDITYILEVTISMQPHPITLRTPITVLSPADTAPPPFSPQNQAFLPLAPEYSKAVRTGSSAPSYSQQGPSYVLPEKSPYPTGGRSASNGGSVNQSAATRDTRHPALAPRVPVNAPQYLAMSNHVSAAYFSSPRPADMSGLAASSHSTGNPDSTSAAARQGQASLSNPWYENMQQASSIPFPLSQGESHEPDPLLYLGDTQSSAPAGTNATHVGSVNASETRLPPAEGWDEHAPAELPSYDDAVGLPNA